MLATFGLGSSLCNPHRAAPQDQTADPDSPHEQVAAHGSTPIIEQVWRESVMHHELFNLLPAATGESQFVVVLFLDVRGFSSFAGSAESVEAALF